MSLEISACKDLSRINHKIITAHRGKTARNPLSDYLLNLRKFLEDRGGNPTEALNCVSICDEYYEALRLLGKYDEGEFGFADDSLKKEFYVPKKDVAVAVIEGLKKFLQNRGEKVDVFGVPRDGNFDNFFSAFNLIMQNYGGTDLYPESEEKLANLFYFLVKNHYFLDGNKRIASVIFLWMIEMNNLMLQEKFGKVLTHTHGLQTCHTRRPK